MAMFAFFHVDKLNKSFFDQAVYEADSLSEMLIRTTYYQMLEDDRERLQQMIDEAGRMERIERIRVFGREGVVNFSTNHAEIGTALSNKDESCVFCHLREDSVLLDASAVKRSRVFTDGSGAEVLGMTKGIYNEDSCYTAACHFHSADEKKLGVLDVVVSLDKVSSLTLGHHADIFISAFLMLLVLSVFQYLFTQKYVCNPLNKLLEHTQKLASGHLEARIEKWPKDEFGDLCQSFNLMANNLAAAQSELREWGHTLEQKVAERTEEMRGMQAQLVQSAKLASMGELVAGIAHEINNPLGGILMFSSLASKSPDVPQQVKDNLEVVVSETKRCAKIVRGLLEFSRESIPEKRLDSVNRILEQTLRLISQQTLFQNIEVQSQFCDELPDVLVDSDQLQQVFFNILINAGQAMEQGGNLHLVTLLDREKEAVVIKIADDGVGIDKENLDKIFDPFFSTKNNKGFGLGLSISYGIIENHDGQISVQSQIGEGTQFTISLPIVPAAASSAVQS
jgi:two-component system NtrC family sensor kinase